LKELTREDVAGDYANALAKAHELHKKDKSKKSKAQKNKLNGICKNVFMSYKHMHRKSKKLRLI